MTSSQPIVIADAISKDYPVRRGLFGKAQTVHAAHDVSFTVAAGETLAIVGESGCGKSTLARMLTLLELPTRGRLVIDGVEPTERSTEVRRRLRRTVQMVFQNPYGSLNPRQKIGDALAEPLAINTGLSARARREAAAALLAQVGLRPEFIDRYPHMFSGGQRQRIAIARALILKPKLLILDEPVSALDISIRAQILNLLADLKEQYGLTYVFISHDLGVVRHVADRVMVMYLGRVVESGNTADIFARPQHPYTRALLSATPSTEPGRKSDRIRLKGELPSPFHPPSGCAFHPRCPLAFDRCQRETPVLTGNGSMSVACFAAPAPALEAA